MIKAPLFDENADIIGIIGNSIDITAHKEAGSLRIENEKRYLRSLLEEQEKFQKLAYQVAHDISSPLTSLSVLAEHYCTNLPEAEPTAFKRMISNLMNNSIEALEKGPGEVSLRLKSDENSVHISVEDTGKGMTPEVMEKIKNKIAVTSGKAGGHGIGFGQIQETILASKGKLDLKSKIGLGTTVSLTFPKISPPSWVATEIVLTPQDLLVVLDDDPSIHQTWALRFENVFKEHPQLQVKNFHDGAECLSFLKTLSPKEREQTFLLSDFELLKQNINGLEVISQAQIPRSALVTSHYANPTVLQGVKEAKTRLLPKLLVPQVSVRVSVPIVLENEEKIVDLVLLDDNVQLVESLMKYTFKNHTVDFYHTPKKLYQNIEKYSQNTVFLLDHEFKDTDVTGIEFAAELYGCGFTNLYLYSGYAFHKDKLPNYLKYISKTDLSALKALLSVTRAGARGD